MELTQSAFDVIMTGYKAVFRKAYAAAEPEPGWDKLVTPIKSDARREVHSWLGRTGGMGLWVGPKARHGVLAANFTVPNLDFEDTLEFDRNDLEDDSSGGFDLLIQQMAADAAVFPIKLTQMLIANGTATTMTLREEKVSIASWDGKALFASARTIGKDSGQTNIYSGTGVTYDKVIDDWQKVRVGMRGLQNGSGQRLSRRPTLAVIPNHQGLITAFDTILANRAPLGTTDVRGSLAGYLINDEWDGNDWAAFDVSRVIGPLLLQTRKAPRMVTPQANSDAEFDLRKITPSVEARWGLAPCDWTCAALVQNS